MTQPSRAYKARGVVLRARPLGEADRIFTLFTLEYGKLHAVAKGVRRAKSHFAGRLEFANECRFGLHRGRSLDVIVSADIVHAHWSKLVQPDRFGAAALVAELIDAFCEPALEASEVYTLLTGALQALARSSRPQTLLPRFQLRLLDVLGFAPPPDRCVRCGGDLGEGGARVDAVAGGLIDSACAGPRADLPALDGADRENFRALCAGRGAAPALLARPNVARAVEELLAHQLGRRPNAGPPLAELTAGR